MGLLCLLRNKDSGAPAVDPVQSIGHDQLLLRDSYAPHYTTAEWPGYEHLLADRKYTVGTLRTPRAGRCWLFDGTDDYATRAHPLASASDFTVMAWVKMTSAGSYPMIMASDGASKLDFRFDNTTLRLQLAASDATGANGNVVGTTTLSTGTWYHVAATYTASTRTATLYINGVSDGSAVFAAGSGGTPNNIVSGTNMQLGLRVSSYPFTGRMRDFRLYSNVKSAAEILAIKNQADTPGTYDTTGLLAGYWCEEESGTTGYDWSGNGRHLTLTNITQSTFHAADTGVNYSSANADGFTQQRNIIAVESQTFNSASWYPNDCTVTANVTTGPTGEANADRLDFAGVAYQRLTRFNPLDGGSAIVGTYVFSVYLKADSALTVSLWLYAGGTNKTVTCSLTTSWQRFEICMTFTGNADQRLAIFADGLGPITVYAADAQCELGMTATTFQSGGPNNTLIVPKVSGASNDVVSRTLQYTGKCPQPGYAPQKCITPDGVNDYATAGNGIGNALGGSFTAICVSAWCYLASAGNGGVVFIGTFGTAGKVSLFTFGGSAYFRLNGSSDANSSTGMSVGTWSHIAGTWDGTTQRLYVNGVQVASTAFSTAISATAIQTVLGTYAENFYNWPGRFCDVRIFSSNKTQAQIQAIMAGGTDTASLLAHWPCCEGPGSSNTNTTIYDVSGNGYNATITNATVANYWANSTTYDSRVVNYPLKYGYTVNGSGVIVPALISGASDAAGNAIGQAAGGWASGLQNLNCLPYTNPLGVSVGLETSLDPTADRKTASSSKRRRRNTSGLYDRFGARSTAMSDASSNAYFGD